MAEAIESIDISKQASFYQKKITTLVIFKGQIFLKLGYLENAYEFFTKVQSVISGSVSAPKNDVESVLHMSFAEAVDYLECVLGIVSVDLELSRFQEVEAILTRCEKVISTLFRSKDSDMARRVKILRLQLAKETLDFELRNKVADELSDIYQNYDHYRLLRCEDFMKFVQERVAYLLDDCKTDSALARVDNILTVLDDKKSRYWVDQFKMLQARCLTTLRKPHKAYDILQEILQNRVLKLPEGHKMKDYRLFIEIHLALADLYYYREEYKNSIKCLKFVVQDYYKNNKLFKTLPITETLKMAIISLDISNAARKLPDFDMAQRYLKS